jgi:alpha-L-arabinofuranosidase
MAAELVRYANLEQGYQVEYWSIGNEPTLYERDTGEPYDTVRFNQEWRAIALAMKAVDPTIKLMGPELHQWGTSAESTLRDSSGRDWMTEFLKENGDLVDVVTVHRYPLWKPYADAVTPSELRENTQEWESLVIYLRQLIHKHVGRDLPIAFTEVNSDPRSVMMGEATPDTLYNAIWYADVLGKLGQQDVFMVNQWVVSQPTTGLGLFMRSTIRPTLHTFSLYKHFGTERVYASSDFDYVNIYAARREDGALSIMIINLNDEQKNIPLRMDGMQFESAEVWRLDDSHQAEQIDSISIGRQTVLILPAWSATLYILNP